VIASVGTTSGPAGSTLGPIAAGAALWVKYINAHGGLNGHPIKHIAYDDGGDPARHSALVKQAIEQEKAIAFLINVDNNTGAGDVDYITSKRVPVVGLPGGESWAYKSPMYFPHVSSDNALYLGILPPVTSVVKPSGKTKLATVSCREAQGCKAADSVISQQATGLGFEQVYRGQASVAQPDFTAECLSAQKAGAEVFLIIMDPNSVSRLTASCARQNYRPRYATTSNVVVDRFKDDPNMAGLVAGTVTFPYFQSGTPATDQYQKALVDYGNGLANGAGVATGWTAGKLLEKATQGLPDAPTSADILKGLWSIRNDDLDKLTRPLTFTENQPATPMTCWFTIEVSASHSWASPDGFDRHCL
jgi:branched-chain amino acid transport system substrate-binding protein